MTAFYGCESLTEVIISEGVKEIKDSAFTYCDNLQKIYCPKTLINLGNIFLDTHIKLDFYYAGTEQEWNNIPKGEYFESGMDLVYHFNSKYQTNGRWIKSGSRWWYRYEDGSYPKNKLCKIGNTWYGFDAAGWMRTGWASYDKNWYYFASSGAMKTGWFAENKTWYYLKSDGKMAKGWLKVDGAWYYFNGSGKMAKGFTTVGNAKYYMNGSGRMVTGWQKINGSWYYFVSSGAMKTGWQKVGGKWYYLDASGKMAANRWVGNWYVNGSGVWVKSR